MAEDIRWQFAWRLLSQFPEFAQCTPTEKRGSLIFLLPCPSRSDCGVGVLTGEDEIIVAFGVAHSHFPWRRLQTTDQAFERALEFIGELLDERVCAIVRQEEDGTCRYGFIAPEKVSGDLPEGTRYVRSWRGTYDREAA